MTAQEILQEFVRIRPDFEAYGNDGDLFLRDDGSFTACGVFSQFTDFFRERHLEMKKEELEAIATLVGRCETDDFLTESAYTCFLENIAGDPPDETLAPYLSRAALQFMSHWRPEKKSPTSRQSQLGPSARVAHLKRSAKMKLYTMIAHWGDDAIVLQTEARDENEALVHLIGKLPDAEEEEIADEDITMLGQFARREKQTKLTPCAARSTWVWFDGLKLARPLTAYIVETSP